ncbi:hypothetical protein [Chloroflexus sp.]|uniref:hypothetical protein n=1 Tax=Chloroflexus sp. TaxID=1904827 RepID=UPI002ACE6826|nr:hypothetical protein [Chloroflexus sp.]
MNINDVKLLQSIRSDPSLTITLPTHRTSPDNKQDPIRVKNLVTAAANRLTDTYGKRAVEPILRRLEALAGDIDYRYTLDGLAIVCQSRHIVAVYGAISVERAGGGG